MKTYTLSKWKKGTSRIEKLVTGTWKEMREEEKKLYKELVENEDCHYVHWDVSGVVWEENSCEWLAYIS